MKSLETERCLGGVAWWMVALGVAGCGGRSPEQTAATGWFVDITPQSGVEFRHRRCGAGDKHLLEMNGGGVSVLDYDQDGDLDLFFPQGSPLPGFDPLGADLRDRMYCNDGGWKFTDVTDLVHCDDGRYTYSANAADYDGDGDPDLFLCNWGCNRLLRNDGGVFVDVSDAAHASDTQWTSCSAAADFDQDGDLDYYVGNYCVYDLEHPMRCGEIARGPEYLSYCHPDQFQGERDQLLRNDGNGNFTDVTLAAGLAESRGKCLGLVTSDFDNDGDVDLFVANDSTPRFLWRNDGALRFTDVGRASGMALSEEGLSQASMGTDAADIDFDGDFDVVFTNLANEYNALIRNDGDGFFTDRSFESGVGYPSLPWVGFGVRFFDAELDGDEDMVVINGHVVDNIHLYKQGETFEQPSHLYLNGGIGRFTLADPGLAGAYFARREVGRALATWDPDDDGDLDLVIVNNDGPAVLLENRAPRSGHWIGFRLKGRAPNTAAIGARIAVSIAEPVHRLLREQRGSSSYNSFHDLRLLFGLGANALAQDVQVRWPRGANSELGDLPVDRYHTIEEPAD